MGRTPRSTHPPTLTVFAGDRGPLMFKVQNLPDCSLPDLVLPLPLNIACVCFIVKDLEWHMILPNSLPLS